MSFLHKKVCILLLVTLALGVSASAQTDSGSIAGVVQDPEKGAVVSATVSVTDDRTGEERKVTTNSDGSFVVSPLRPSVYTIEVTKDGFASAKATGVRVTVGLEIRRDITLQLASRSEAVTVIAGEETPMDTTSSRIGVNVTEREVSNLPINGRQLSQLELQAPGATNAGTGNFQDIRFSGQSTEQNAIRYDGVDGSAVIDADP